MRRPFAVPVGGLVRVLLAVLMVAVAGCAPQEGSEDPAAPTGASAKIDVGAPELVKIKQGSGIANCPEPETEDGGLPEHTLQCLGGGRPVDLSTLQGPLVLNFFFGTCKPCREEMPALEAFHQQYGDQVPIIGVDSMDTYPGVALELAIDRGVTYPLVADPLGDLQGSELSVRAMPTFFFLDEDGTISRAQGGLESEAEVVALVEEHLGIDLE